MAKRLSALVINRDLYRQKLSFVSSAEIQLISMKVANSAVAPKPVVGEK